MEYCCYVFDNSNQLNIKYRPGLRAIKTAIAVAICIIISNILNRPDAFCSAIATIICMKQTYKETVSSGISRFIGTFLGGIVGYLFLNVSFLIPYYRWIRVIVIPIALLLVIYILNTTSQRDAISIGCIVVLVIVAHSESGESDALIYVVDRIFDTIIGVVVATVINMCKFTKIKSHDPNQIQSNTNKN